MLYRFLTISFALIFFCMKSAYAEPKQMTLREAIYLALAYNVSIENEELRRIADKFNLKVVYVYENLINIVIIIKKRIWNLLKKQKTLLQLKEFLKL